MSMTLLQEWQRVWLKTCIKVYGTAIDCNLRFLDWNKTYYDRLKERIENENK